MYLAVALHFATLLLSIATYLSGALASEFCDSQLKSTDTDQARILRGLANVRFTAGSHNESFKTEYTVGLCGNASKTDPLAGVLQNGTTVLGRVNDTHVVKGVSGDWIMMMFGSGDPYPEKYNCSGPRYTFVMIHCNHNISAENSMKFIKEAKEKKDVCFFMFEIPSQLVCLQPEKIGGGTVFAILFLFVALTYIIGGILYRRLVLGSKGIEQIPNLTFWKAVGSRFPKMFRGICCEKSSVNVNSWENLGSRTERDDDSLLPP